MSISDLTGNENQVLGLTLNCVNYHSRLLLSIFVADDFCIPLSFLLACCHLLPTATVFGMTWARAAIFWLSDYGHDVLLKQGYSVSTATVLPPLAVSAMVQVMNQPIVRSTVTLQDPKYNLPNALQSCKQIYNSHGIAGLWHGTTAGVLKTVPKYVTAIVVKVRESFEVQQNNRSLNTFCIISVNGDSPVLL